MPEKKKANTSYVSSVQPASQQQGQWSPFGAANGPFQSVALPQQQPVPTRAPSNVSGGTEYGQLAGNTTLEAQGVPQSFVDGIADLLQRDRVAGNPVTSFNGIRINNTTQGFIKPGEAPVPMTQEQFDTYVNTVWNAAPPDQKQKYIAQDQATIAGIQKSNLQNQAMAATLGAPETNRNANNSYWGSQVTPAENRATQAQNALTTGNRALEGELGGYVGTYTDTLNRNEAARMGNINETNSLNSGLANRFMDETLAANQRNTQLGQDWTTLANNTNANQTQLFDTYRGQMAGYNANQNALTSQNASTLNNISANQSALSAANASELRNISANQTGLYNQFMGDIANANSQQNANLGQFGRSVSSHNATANNNLANLGARTGEYNQRQLTNLDDLLYDLDRFSGQQTDALSVYASQLSKMNEADQTAYLQYIAQTDPLMAERLAQGSSQELVGNQQDVLSRYRTLSNPEVTGQERLLAELARRKFEADDKSSRDAQMQALQARGLRSGGLQIANQQATRQQLAQDRQLNELGLQAQAVARSQEALAGYGNMSNILRNADDSMRQFQDVYRQNEAVRVGNLAQQRNQQSLVTNKQMSDRDTANYNATTQTIRDNTDRSNLGYNARTQTNELNYGRDYNYYTASQDTNNDNYMRDRDLYGAQTQTVNDNFGRTQAGAEYGYTTNQANTARSNDIFNNGTVTNTTNTARANDIFNNGSTTNRDNSMRDTGVFNAGTQTNDANYGRSSQAIGANLGINQTNLGNLGVATTNSQNINSQNSDRYQGGLNSGNLAAGSILGAQTGLVGFKGGNLVNEANTATNNANSAAGRAQTFAGIQNSTTAQQQEALYRALGLSDKEIAEIMGGVKA